jgi:HD superfamily phosphodiesterase
VAAVRSPIALPDSRLAREATELIRSIEPDLLYNHSLRVYAFGCLQAERRGLSYDAELLYIGAMFHDIGLVEGHRSAHDRFEVDGANAAREALRIVWDESRCTRLPASRSTRSPRWRW